MLTQCSALRGKIKLDPNVAARWTSGYEGGEAEFISPDVLCYKCGNNIKFQHIDGSRESFCPSAGDGVGALAVHTSDRVR